MMKVVLISTTALMGTLLVQAADRPNIVYVFPDQLRNHALEFWNDDDFSKYVRFKADPVHTPRYWHGLPVSR